jgi:hypothetical protein
MPLLEFCRKNEKRGFYNGKIHANMESGRFEYYVLLVLISSHPSQYRITQPLPLLSESIKKKFC